MVLDNFVPGEGTDVPLERASGLVLASAVLAAERVPSFANSAMDGFALRAADVSSPPARLRIVEEIMAGDGREVLVGPQMAARIMTGAPLPAGADAVCPFERAAHADRTSVLVDWPIPPGTNVRVPGEDIELGQVVLAAGSALNPAANGVLGSLGRTTVRVHRAPLVGVLSTGDELVQGPGTPPAGKVRDANRPALLAAVLREGFVPVDLGIVGDEEAAVFEVLAAAGSNCDAIIVSAGVSAGDRDVVGKVLGELSGGCCEQLHVALRPGRPLAVCRLRGRGVPVVGLPGNPVAAMVGFELFVRPGLRRLAGRLPLDRPLRAAHAACGFGRSRDGKVHVLGVHAAQDAAGELRVTQWGARGSHQLCSFATCNALAILPDGEGVPDGGTVSVMLLEEAETSGLLSLE
jgi:molybdopterin molybdotransferase